jgi:DNA-binding GntR family transcriptional regulator
MERMTIPQPGSRSLPARRPLVDDVYDAVLGLLMDQVIAPGARASIDGIARELDVSPTPVREALARLESEGLVVKKALRGYTAAPLLDDEGLRQLYEVRGILEPYAAGAAAARLDAAGIAELERVSEQMARSGEAAQSGADRFQDYRDFADHDAAFHHRIAAASGNDLLLDGIVRLRSHMHLFRLYFVHGIAQRAVEEHEAILVALRAGDVAGAEEAMRAHIARSYERISSGAKGSES